MRLESPRVEEELEDRHGCRGSRRVYFRKAVPGSVLSEDDEDEEEGGYDSDDSSEDGIEETIDALTRYACSS